MEDNTETISETNASSSTSSTSADSDPNHTVNIREVKHKTLALLTELYRTETGDVKRMAMSLLQTLYTIEDQEQVAEMNGKIQKLMKLIEEQKREQAELEEASLAGSHDSAGFHINVGTRSRALTDESNLSADKQVTVVQTGSAASASDDEISSAGHSLDSSEKENNLMKRWQEKFENFRVKQESRKQVVVTTNQSDDNNHETPKTNNNNNNVGVNQWRENMSTRMDASRERWANGWRESTSKIQQGWKERNQQILAKTTEDTADDDDNDNASVSTEGSSSPPSPVSGGSAASSVATNNSNNNKENNKEDDLLLVIRNFVKDGVDSKKSRDSLELALNIRRQKARNRWAETRAKWKWPNNAAQAQESL
mmetsp:Transcript_41431/g.99801  ORF Transcript_41431/g.99801 Transcript_41431/m.99801 type:complete len:368 (-) Transcript_41431:238-1341(-)